jgi:hypothetical protein
MCKELKTSKRSSVGLLNKEGLGRTSKRNSVGLGRTRKEWEGLERPKKKEQKTSKRTCLKD